MGLPMTVRSEYNLAGGFVRNIFYIEGASGLKYRCSQSGALPLSFVEAASYPYTVMERMPKRISGIEKETARLREELPILEEIIGREWPKATEPDTLKAQCRELQQKIDEELKKAERGSSEASDTPTGATKITEAA